LHSVGDIEAQPGAECRNFGSLSYLTSIADHFPPLFSLPSVGVRALKYHLPDTRARKKRSLLFEVLLMNLTTLHPERFFFRSFCDNYGYTLYPFTCPSIQQVDLTGSDLAKEEAKIPCLFFFQHKRSDPFGPGNRHLNISTSFM